MKRQHGLGRWLMAGAASAAIVWGVGEAVAQDLPKVPRNRTLISQGWDFYNQVPSIDNFNPYAGVLLHQRNNLHYTVYESLFYTNHFTNELIPWIAESYTYNKDFTELTVKLRDGVRWSDGKPLTAEDVVFTFDMLKGAAPDLLFSSAIAEWVDSAKVVDPLTVTIKLKKPGPRWAADFLATGQSTRFVVVPKHIWEGKDPKTFANFDLAKGLPVGTGPYKLVKADASSLFFDRRDNWWAKDVGLVKEMPKVERVIYVPATAEAMPQLYATNQIDIGRNIQSGVFEAIKVQNPNLTAWNAQGPVWGAPNGCVIGIRFNVQKPPFNDVALRQAVNAAIDRDQIVNLAYEGSVKKAVLPFSSYRGMLDYVDGMGDIIQAAALDKRSVERVAEILTKAGYKKNSAGRWQLPDGSPLEIRVSVGQGDPVGPVLGEQLRSAGFDTVVNVQQSTAQTEALTAGNFGLSVYPHCGSLYDPWQTLEHFHSKYAPKEGEAAKNLRAPTRYANPELDAILDKLEAKQPSPKDADYVALAKQATAIIARDLPEIALFEEIQTQPFNTTYWTGFPSSAQPYVAQPLPWEGFALVIHRLQPKQ
ncbi:MULTISPECIES: ABC transporter substrate-binding protein [unclassified Chelatococcus]|uniref:ABC transporter substrate-binding protein n=1 Tax=unclassified Chelatococcus TaxID=2638111 RepID=UPI001BD14407|nr:MULTISPECIES: ABC transporter substrate-binding protein [unclassified Chelatococcus]CAH1648197.1 Peptide/nickel transport system substrate-binding protein [Hyphomicrobiales bacterium]MBS7742039.1 ABC transporter substrate-binding protein [Chelatococcus sp. HY11]MBX3541163.1 ABC transporter substrate-binding protein [Chelatococcus sp.]MCO5074942.1 ABC transporter substrate-binding protein [Chelatococcus sp.]CAH1690524.1 Peptide/nickel transport system substrate-binding protein [Hyphomicrobia